MLAIRIGKDCRPLEQQLIHDKECGNAALENIIEAKLADIVIVSS